MNKNNIGNRELIFRAMIDKKIYDPKLPKKIIYGYYYFNGYDYKIVDKKGIKWIVDPKTVGQFTGLLDKNGKKIFEGDIIKKSFSDRPYSKNKKFKENIMVVVYYTHKAQNNKHNNKILKKDPSAFNSNPMFIGEPIRDDSKFHHGSWSEFASCEVIGNVFENPELLK